MQTIEATRSEGGHPTGTGTPAENRAEVAEVDRRRNVLLATSLMGLSALAAIIWAAPPQAWVPALVLVLVGVKKASVRYVALGKRREELLTGAGHQA